MEPQKKFILKVILLGDSSVGKTSLLNKYIKNDFSLHYKATIGADFLTKQLQRENSLINLQIWDTAGSERYHSIGTGFYRNCECCVLVCDLTNTESFKSVEFWRKEFIKNANPQEGDKFPFVLFANKNDMVSDIKITEDEIKSFCSAHNDIPYFMVSAKEGNGVEEGFNKIFEKIKNILLDPLSVRKYEPLKLKQLQVRVLYGDKYNKTE